MNERVSRAGTFESGPDARTLRLTTEACCTFLDAFVREDWSSPIPEMSWNVAETVAHMAGALLWYSNDFSAGATELSSVEVNVSSEADPSELIRTARTWSKVLATVIESSEPGERGWHPCGIADASGFAAMACDELLIHTSDAASGFNREFTPPPGLADTTLRRLFPWVPLDVDPWQALNWANGRVVLPGRKRLSKWRWHCAPLSEWDGTDPSVSC